MSGESGLIEKYGFVIVHSIQIVRSSNPTRGEGSTGASGYPMYRNAINVRPPKTRETLSPAGCAPRLLFSSGPQTKSLCG